MKYILIIYFFQIVNCLNLPKVWHKVSLPFKNKARTWFIERAESSGIPWNNLQKYYSGNHVDKILKQNIDYLNNTKVVYPDYYMKPFHGYDKGNLNWLAAQEGEAATLNIAAGYWPKAKVGEAQNWMRKNTTDIQC